MSTHNIVIYHCVKCGNVVHREPDEQPPVCCRRLMVNAATETVRDGGEVRAPEPGAKPPAPGKPR